MFEGKERRHQLIEELRTTHALQQPEQLIQKKESEMIKGKKRAQEKKLHKASCSKYYGKGSFPH